MIYTIILTDYNLNNCANSLILFSSRGTTRMKSSMLFTYYNDFFPYGEKMDYSIRSSSYKYVSYEPLGNFEKIFVAASVYYYVFFFHLFSWYTFIYYILTNHPTPPVPKTTTDSWEISFIVAYV